MSEIQDLIAGAIQKADSSYFFENYNKQAAAVLAALQKEGYAVVPKKPSEKQLAIGKAAVTSGRVKPSDLVEMIYSVMVNAK
jgi:predicted CoA-binding protein